MAMRRENPAPGCSVSKEELISDGFKYSDDCPICRDDYNVLCRVAKHLPHPLLPSTGKSVYLIIFLVINLLLLSAPFQIQSIQTKKFGQFLWKN
jgi:hypothetical protein